MPIPAPLSVCARRFLDLAKTQGATITSLLQTHGHIDHMAGVRETKDALPDAKIYLHKGDYPLYKQASALVRMRACDM